MTVNIRQDEEKSGWLNMNKQRPHRNNSDKKMESSAKNSLSMVGKCGKMAP